MGKKIIKFPVGSIASYAVIGIVLIALLAGGISLAKLRQQSFAKGSTEKVTYNDPKPPTQTTPPKEQGSVNGSTSQAPPQAPANSTTPPPSGVAQTGPTAVPSTGLSDSLGPLLSFGLLGASLTAYFLSEKTRSRNARLRP